MITVAELECTSQNADGVVVGLLAPPGAVGDPHESRVTHVEKPECAKFRAPDAIQDRPVRAQRHRGHVEAGDASRTVGQILVEHLATGPCGAGARNLLQVAVVGELLSEGEGTCRDACVDATEMLPGAAQGGLSRSPWQRRPIPNTGQHKGELDAVRPRWPDAARQRPSTHDGAPCRCAELREPSEFAGRRHRRRARGNLARRAPWPG